MDQIFVLHADMHSEFEGLARNALLIFLEEMRHVDCRAWRWSRFRPSRFPRERDSPYLLACGGGAALLRCPGRGGRSPRRMGAAFVVAADQLVWWCPAAVESRGFCCSDAVAGSPHAMRVVSRAALCACVDASFWHESLCLNSGRIGGAARGRVARAPPCRALGVCKRGASHRASGVRTLASKACHSLPSSRHKASTPASSAAMYVTPADA